MAFFYWKYLINKGVGEGHEAFADWGRKVGQEPFESPYKLSG